MQSSVLFVLSFCIATSLARDYNDSYYSYFKSNPNDPISIKSVKTPEGDVFDCIHIEDQQGLKYPGLKGHRIKQIPNSNFPRLGIIEGVSSSLTSLPSLDCPHGTVPELRLPSSEPDKNRKSFSHSRLGNTSSTVMKFVSAKPATRTVDAGHVYKTPSTGVFALLEIWKPNVENSVTEFSGSFISVQSGKDQILAGWLVYPGLYGDDNPRFTVANTNDNFTSKACFNTACGFVVVNNTIALGLAFASISTAYGRTMISLSITYDSKVKGWVLTANQLFTVGYWPNRLFKNLNSGLAEQVFWGGRIANSFPSGRYTKTQMGNGLLASTDKAAVISYLIYTDANKQLQLPYTNPLAPAKCYTVRFSTFTTAIGLTSKIFYGGSGLNTGCSSPYSYTPSPPPPAPQAYDLFSSAPFSMIHKNKYFRYTSYRYTGYTKKPSWDLAPSINFIASDKVANIEDQGMRNGSWIFAAAASFESVYAGASGSGVPSVSKQQLLDCALSAPTKGSWGKGWATDSFEYMATTGLGKSLQYPYIGRRQQCFSKNTPKANIYKIAMYEEVDFYGSFGLILAVQNQPVVVNLQARSAGFQSYKKGVFDREDCFTDFVDHSVVVVGYQLLGSAKPYWILRNSFGESWGEKGYMRIAYTGGDGICGMHTTPAYYPVLPYTVGVRNPCGPPNPCGGGKCSKNKKTGKNFCTCPQGFVSVTNIDGTQTCTLLNPCQMKPFNPCGNGLCVNDQKGSYTCICPPGFTQGLFSNVDDNTCIPATSTSKQLSYTVQASDTCQLIALAYRLPLAQFVKQNKNVKCTSLKPRTVVNVTPSSNWRNCAVTYSWNTGDSCNGIQSLFRIDRASLLAFNPGLVCTNAIPGFQVCVKQGEPVGYASFCSEFYTIQNGDTCQSIITKWYLDPFTFFVYNRGINCQALSPSKSIARYFDQVCIDSSYPGTVQKLSGDVQKLTGAAQCKGRSKQIARFDTCASIVIKYFERSFNKFRSCNKEKRLVCSRLQVGTPYCLC